MTRDYQLLPPKPRKVARLKQCNKSNRLMRRHYQHLRTERVGRKEAA